MDTKVAEVEALKNNLASMEKIVSSLNSASGSLIGRGAQALMYQTGKDMGKKEGEKFDHTSELAVALKMIVQYEKGVFDIDLWKDSNESDYYKHEDNITTAKVVFRECPIRQVCLSYGVPMDDVICRISSGLIAGMLSSILQKKVDVKVEHAGPNSCLKVVSMKD